MVEEEKRQLQKFLQPTKSLPIFFGGKKDADQTILAVSEKTLAPYNIRHDKHAHGLEGEEVGDN